MAVRVRVPWRLLGLASTPSSPPAGYVDTYAKTDGKPYAVNESGVEFVMTGVDYTTGASNVTRSPKMTTLSGTTDSTGKVTFTLPASRFTAIDATFASVVRNTTAAASAAFAMVVTQSATQVVCMAYESKSTAAGIAVEGLEACGAGITINLLVIGT